MGKKNSGKELLNKKFENDITNPSKILLSSNDAIVLCEVFPKAEFHFLIVPKAKIESVCELNRTHLPLLQDMLRLAHKIRKLKAPHLEAHHFLYGFQVGLAFDHLNMHVISKDFMHLKHYRHWALFNTRIFLSYKEVYAALHAGLRIKPLDIDEKHKLQKGALKCHECNGFITLSLEKLKNHIRLHWNEIVNNILNN